MVFRITSGKQQGFTFVEVMIVLAMVALLLSIAVPRYFAGLERAKESVLKQDLQTMRQAIDDYYSDHGNYPSSIETLVDKRYLRAIPVDPVTESKDTWLMIAPPSTLTGVYDIKSGAEGSAIDGSLYIDW